MSLTKIVNGNTVVLSPEEEQVILDERAASEAAKQKFIDEELYKFKRQDEYPPIGDQLDAILKHLNYMQMSGQTDLVKDLDDIVVRWLSVKSKYPKPSKVVSK